MSSPALDSTLPPSNAGVSTALESPIARSGPNGGAAKVEVEDAPLTGSRSSPGNGGGGGVSELLQRALSLKEGSDLDEIKDGERTPGSHSRASTDLTAVDQLRVSPADPGSKREHFASDSPPDEVRSSGHKTETAASPPSAEAHRSREPKSRRPLNRPHAPTQFPPSHQQRVSPPQGWQGPSPDSSSDTTNYTHVANSGAQAVFYPHHLPNTGTSTNGGGVYGYSSTSTPPFLAHLPRHPSQISQISDHSTGYSTGSPYSSSSSSLWYQHYASTVTTPSSYPAALEGGLVYPTDTSPEPAFEGFGSSQQCLPTSTSYAQFEAIPPGYVAGAEFVEPANTASPVGPYSTVYFGSAMPQRMVYGPTTTAQSQVDAYPTNRPALSTSASAGPRPPSQATQMAYPITSARPHAMGYAEQVPSGYQQNQNWRASRHQPTLVPMAQQQQYTPPYYPYPTAVQHTNPSEPRRYSQYHPQAPVHFSQPQPGPAPRPFPSATTSAHPPAIPPRPALPPQHAEISAGSAFAPPSSPPKIYAPPREIARGVLASTRLREAAQPSGTTKPVRATRNENASRSGPGARKGNLPKPPAHSPHALWVGNVPSDASHSELWQFFVTRPPPSAVGILSSEDVDLSSPGVESIHLIARSNCAFVNYLSNLHLHHAISISNGLSLRPNDPRCKPLLCRVRKEDDDSKTGVGAQRVGGIHKAFVKLQRERMGESEQVLRHKIEEHGAEPKSSATRAFEERRQSSSSASAGTTSTTSSFLTKHFEKRWFIMKSHDEADLKLSVESGLWATQPHNEPVLQQAFRTAKEVFLVFSANGSGEWFGYARMKGPISSVSSSKGSRPSWGSSGQASIESVSSASLSVPSQTIQEDTDEPTSFPPRAPVLFSPSEHRLAQASPSLITPTTASKSHHPATEQRHGGSYPLKLPSEIDAEAKREMALEQERMAFVTSSNLHLPPEVAEAARKAATYDSGALKKARELNDEVPPGSLRDAILRVDMATKEETAVTAQEPQDEGRKPARSGSSSTWGTPFSIEWIKVIRLPFSRTRHIRNSFNGNREIKVSRDGTEVEPGAGQALIDEFDGLVESPKN
ncbi:hypothetical protein JCM3766R1_002097 [Sporobolomyces carnicolor]